MNKNFTTVLLVLMTLIACKNNTTTTSKVMTQSDETISDNEKHSAVDTIHLLNIKDKTLFEIFAILPDSSMGKGHSWSKKDREIIYQDALKNYITNDDKYFHVKELISDKHLKVSLGDAYWELLIYKTNRDGCFTVVTHLKGGDADSFFTYTYYNGQLSVKSDFFPLDYLVKFFNQQTTDNCTVVPDGEFELMLDYEFINDTVLIENYYSKQDSICFLGNTLVFKYNPLTAILDFREIRWVEL
ncbi:hypothetical protein ACT3CD_10395 [Geofilum sp. OHC36d9]|uniref:hypothetical protein n=1 Tax=Geofilum sp. OHC36d9 TaxID=3458413 RepID=UPI00403374A2